jgi:cytochrome c oxidase subunit 4
MHGATVEEIKKETRGYVLVFVALAALTVITVGVSYLHLPVAGAVTLALAIAIIKGSLVAAYFMHLISERKVIYAVLILTVVFFAVLMMMPTYGHIGRVVGGP